MHAAPPFRTSYAQVVSASDDGLSDGVIIGIVFGAFHGLIILTGGVIFIRYKVWKSAPNVKPKAEPSPQRADI